MGCGVDKSQVEQGTCEFLLGECTFDAAWRFATSQKRARSSASQPGLAAVKSSAEQAHSLREDRCQSRDRSLLDVTNRRIEGAFAKQNSQVPCSTCDLSTPHPIVALPCGSRSISSVRRLVAAKKLQG